MGGLLVPDIIALLSKDRFATWLHSHNPAANVGTSGTVDACPLATYLRSNGVPSARVGVFGETISFDDKRVKPPQWVRDFVSNIDALHDDKGEIRDHVRIRAYRAWNVLEEML